MSTTSLVPPRRLGALLRRARIDAGTELPTLATGADFSVVELDDIEHGRRDLDRHLLDELMTLYGIENADLVPARSQLVIDLDDGRISIDETGVDTRGAGGPDAVLARYLSLVYRLRGLPLGTRLHLRDVDLDVLSDALVLEAMEVEDRLQRLMRDESMVAADQKRIRRFVLLPLVGVMIAATSVGTLVLVADDAPTLSPETRAAIDTGTARIAPGGATESAGIVTDIGNGGAVEYAPSSVTDVGAGGAVERPVDGT